MNLTHRKGCDPRERTSTSCPCGVTDAYLDHLQSRADDYADRYEMERDR